ncbi:hypothetical protein EW026_g5700 [Hermanssonia centrifuga]|uniref:Uncharacterized protein n=1 Tax=Hermanssonia centrifuga TaxID=98765 RepID=A0A4S4KD99_9APHY|nr:hypothetical protein EW026_g5700 [Hermanssonia centrifuga]
MVDTTRRCTACLINCVQTAIIFFKPIIAFLQSTTVERQAESPSPTPSSAASHTKQPLPLPPTLSYPPKSFDPMTTVRVCLGMVVRCISHGEGVTFEPRATISRPDTLRLEEEPTYPIAVGMHVQFYYINPDNVLKFRRPAGELAFVKEIEAVGKKWTCFKISFSKRAGSAHLMVPNAHAEWTAEWAYVHDYLEAVSQLPDICSEPTDLYPRGAVSTD